jgi:hypothetical protein
LPPLDDEAQALIKGSGIIEIRHIPREENTAADERSNRAIDLSLQGRVQGSARALLTVRW